MKDTDTDLHRTKQWPMRSGLEVEPEGMITVQDESLATRLHHSNIIKDGTNPLCRILCRKFDGSVDHIISGCPESAKMECIQKHDNAASYIDWKVSQSYDMTTDKMPSSGTNQNCCKERTSNNFCGICQFILRGKIS